LKKAFGITKGFRSDVLLMEIDDNSSGSVSFKIYGSPDMLLQLDKIKKDFLIYANYPLGRGKENLYKILSVFSKSTKQKED